MNKKLSALGLALLAFGALPVVAFANHVAPNGITVDCPKGKVTITVAAWSGDVRITEAGLEKGEKLPPSANSSVTFNIADIGGNGSYQITRENPGAESLATDGQASFSVSCTTPTPTPTPTATPTPTTTPTPTATPTPSPTGGTSPATVNPTPPGGGQGQGVLAASTTTPGLPAAGAGPGDPRGSFIVALAVAVVSVLAIARLVKARR